MRYSTMTFFKVSDIMKSEDLFLLEITQFGLFKLFGIACLVQSLNFMTAFLHEIGSMVIQTKLADWASYKKYQQDKLVQWCYDWEVSNVILINKINNIFWSHLSF